MDPDSGESAAQWLTRVDEREIADVLWTYGEERQSRRIASAIVARRDKQPFTRTAELAELIASVMPRGEDKIHPATRSFQAIRIHINRELADLEAGPGRGDGAAQARWPAGGDQLPFAGRPHRQAVHEPPRQGAAGNRRMPELAAFVPTLRPASAARIKAEDDELAVNPRSRSAVLRVAEKREVAGVSRLLLIVLLACTIASAIGVVFMRHRHRQTFIELSKARACARRAQHRIRPPAAGAGDLGRDQPRRPGRPRAARHEVPGSGRRGGGAAMNKSGRNRARNSFNLRQRLKWVGLALGLCSVSLVGRARLPADHQQRLLPAPGRSAFLRELPIATSRGMITDRNGEPLAVSTPVESIWVNPQELLQHAGPPARAGPRAGHAAGRADRQARAERRTRNSCTCAAGSIRTRRRRWSRCGIPGVYSQREFRRFYPQGEAMAHVLGFTNIDDRGQEGAGAGLRRMAARQARREAGDPRPPRPTSSRTSTWCAPPSRARTSTLSIDRRIQYLAYRGAAQRADRQQARPAARWWCWTWPPAKCWPWSTCRPTTRTRSAPASPDAHRNRAVDRPDRARLDDEAVHRRRGAGGGRGHPGHRCSTPTRAAMALRQVHASSDVPHNHGVLDVTGVITKSSNVGAAKIAPSMTDAALLRLRCTASATASSTAQRLPGRIGRRAAAAAALERHRPSTTMSYGYGLSVTPLQIAHAYAAIGNGGRLITPTFVKGQRDEARAGAVDRRSPRKCMAMMETVTEPGGTATQAAILGYHVAGKTGTARKASGGGYSRELRRAVRRPGAGRPIRASRWWS